MTGKEFVLSVLEDGEPHTVREMEARMPSRVTVHSRVADLRRDGYDIRWWKEKGESVYQFVEHRGGPVRVRKRQDAPVQGYTFLTDADDDRNGTVCKILSRASASDHEILENGPAFLVEFGDGSTDVVFSSELRPWFPT